MIGVIGYSLINSEGDTFKKRFRQFDFLSEMYIKHLFKTIWNTVFHNQLIRFFSPFLKVINFPGVNIDSNIKFRKPIEIKFGN